MDSTVYKLSNDILFVIFGPMNRKIWNLQDSTEFWFEFVIWILFESETDTWRDIIRRYRFMRISNMSR
jgi:hypothetical protein